MRSNKTNKNDFNIITAGFTMTERHRPPILKPNEFYTFRSYFQMKFAPADILRELGVTLTKATIFVICHSPPCPMPLTSTSTPSPATLGVVSSPLRDYTFHEGQSLF